MKFAELLMLIGEHYELDDFVYERLELSYKTLCGNKGNKKSVIIDKNKSITDYKMRTHETNTNETRPVELDDLTLRVRYKQGDMIERDCSCDSSFMLEAMNRVGQAIREK